MTSLLQVEIFSSDNLILRLDGLLVMPIWWNIFLPGTLVTLRVRPIGSRLRHLWMTFSIFAMLALALLFLSEKKLFLLNSIFYSYIKMLIIIFQFSFQK